MSRRVLSLIALLATLLGLLVAGAAAPASAATVLPAGFTEAPVAVGGFTLPVGMAWAPDGRMFVAEKRGRVRVVLPDGTLLAEPLVDLQAKVNSYSDRGLLGIATDKDFATNGWLYLLYVVELRPETPDADFPMVSRLTRVTVNPDNTLADPADPETVILGTDADAPCPTPANDQDCIPADYKWHVVGTVRSDPVDGTLWVGTGDTHPHRVDATSYRPLDETTYAGKILHVDRQGRGLPGHSFCPGDADLTHTCTKVYAKGFRNPYRFTLRPGKGPVVGDVGSGHEEEVDLLAQGGSYGWPCYEGAIRTPLYAGQSRCAEEYAKEGTAAAARAPAYRYEHSGGASVIAGPAYSGATYPGDFAGDVFVGDYVQGWVRRLEVSPSDTVTAVHDFATGWPGGVSLEQTPDGDLAYADLGFVSGAAGVRRFAYLPDDPPPVAVASATPTSGLAPLAVQFTGSGSSDPEGQPLTYAWDFGDGSAGSTEADPQHTYTGEGAYLARLTVDDGTDRRPSATVLIQVGTNTAPAASVVDPPAGTTFQAGERIDLTGAGVDPQDGELPDSALAWQVLLHHGSHIHTVAEPTGSHVSFVTADDHDADSTYEVRLTVTDSAGLTATAVRTLVPQTAQVTLASDPAGAPLRYAEAAVSPAPSTRTAAVGYRATVDAAETFVKDGVAYRFAGWSDLGGRQHVVTVPAAHLTLTAHYLPDVATATLEFAPVADAYVDAASPTTNKGDSWGLEADASPQRVSYLRFAVSGLAGRRVLGVRLRMTQAESSPAGGHVFGVTSTSWQESAVTWDTRPPVDGPKLASYSVADLFEEYEASLGAAVVPGDGAVSFAVTSTHPDGSRWFSRESTWAPRLVVVVDALASEPPGFVETVAASAPQLAGAHRTAVTPSGRLLALHGRPGGGVQLAWRDPSFAAPATWRTLTTGSVANGALVPPGTGSVAASVTVRADAGFGWVVVAGAPGPAPSRRPLVAYRLSELDAPGGPRVGPGVVLDSAAAGIVAPDVAGGFGEVAVTWTRRPTSGTAEVRAGFLVGGATDARLYAPAALFRPPAADALPVLVPAAEGTRLVAASGGRLRLFARKRTAPPAAWTTLPTPAVTVAVPTAPSAIALDAAGTLLVAADAGSAGVRVLRVSPAGAVTAEPVGAGLRHPSLAVSGGVTTLVAVRAADGSLVSRTRQANGAWSSLRLDLVTPAASRPATLVTGGRLFALLDPASTGPVRVYQRRAV